MGEIQYIFTWEYSCRVHSVKVVGCSCNRRFIKFHQIWVSSLGVLSFFSSNSENLQINKQKITYGIWVTLKWQWRAWFKMRVHSEQLNLSLKWRIMGTEVRTRFHPIFSSRWNRYCQAQTEKVLGILVVCLFWFGFSIHFSLFVCFD